MFTLLLKVILNNTVSLHRSKLFGFNWRSFIYSILRFNILQRNLFHIKYSIIYISYYKNLPTLRRKIFTKRLFWKVHDTHCVICEKYTYLCACVSLPPLILGLNNLHNSSCFFGCKEYSMF